MSVRQVDQRHVSVEISHMCWSPTMDLIALASNNGEILLHRMSWQKVWTLPPSSAIKKEGAKVTSLAWRPDGRILAAAYNAGKIILVDIENAEILHVHDIGAPLSCLCWTDHKMHRSVEPASSFYVDSSSMFLPMNYASVKNFGSSSKQTEEPADDCKKIKGQENLNFLVAGTTVGFVYMYTYGIFPCGWISVDHPSKDVVSKVLSAALSDDLSILTTYLETPLENGQLVYAFRSFSVPILCTKTEEIKVVALKYSQISSLMTFLESTINAISEAWEDILLEIDTKLLKYAEEKRKSSEGSVSDDFLELLMFGTPSDTLENFLLHDLTENGLKKFGHSIELSYSNIQKLVLKKLQNVAMSLFYHLVDMKGMLLWQEKFGELHFSYDALLQATASVGSFLIKAIEIQQVIDTSMKNFKAFFRWLYAVILRLSDEPIPSEITKVTQQDLNFVAEFLKENFTEEWDVNSKASFKLERIGQYLKNENLAFPPSVTGNPWIAFLSKHIDEKELNELKKCDLLFPYYPEKSLVQQHAEVYKSVELAFNGLWNSFRATVSRRNHCSLWTSYEPREISVSHVTCPVAGTFLSMFTKEGSSANHLYMIQESVNDAEVFAGVGITFGELPRYGVVASRTPAASTSRGQCSAHSVVDAKFYNSNTVTALLSEMPREDRNVLVQVHLEGLQRAMTRVPQDSETWACSFLPVVDCVAHIDRNGHKRLESMRTHSIAVSGPRKVACVLFASRRQVRVYEMEVEEEDDDEEEEDGDEENEATEILEDDSSQAAAEPNAAPMEVADNPDEPLNLSAPHRSREDEEDDDEGEVVYDDDDDDEEEDDDDDDDDEEAREVIEIGRTGFSD